MESALMAMHRTTVRLSESTHELLQREAELAGVSQSQWIREAIGFRLGVVLQERGELDAIAAAIEAARDQG